MLVLLSPSKAMDFEPTSLSLTSTPLFLDQAHDLVDTLRLFDTQGIKQLMKLSDSLAQLNHSRYLEWSQGEERAKQAVLAFAGDTYKDIPLQTYTEEDFWVMQRHVRILSGLYGVLRPLDLIAPYRLEMGTRLETQRGKNLYAYWGDQVTSALQETIESQEFDTVVHCASKEYFKVVDPQGLDARVVEPIFKDWSKGEYKVVSFWAKRARGMMADFIVRERPTTPDDLRGFDRGGYAWSKEESTLLRPLFKRKKG